MVNILWGSPLPPTRSGVSDYAVELLSELHQLCRVRVLAPPDWEEGDWSLPIATVPEETVPEPGEVALLHIGNNPYHTWLFERAMREASVVVLHDLVLHHLLVESTLALGENESFGRILSAEYGKRGEQIADGRAVGLTGRRDPFLFPSRMSVLRKAKAAVVHSQWAARQVIGDQPNLPVGVMHLPARDPGPIDRAGLRGELGIDPDTLLLMHLGFLTPDKGLEALLLAVAAAKRTGVRLCLVLMGQKAGQGDLPNIVSRLDLDNDVRFTGWVSDAEMLRLPAAADLGIVLRDPSAGETSAAVLRFLACGTPVAAVALNQYLEWPGEAVLRVTPGSSMAADLSRLIIDFNCDPTVLSRRRKAAREAFMDNHVPVKVAHQLLEFLETITTIQKG